jgi:hypothetical protein
VHSLSVIHLPKLGTCVHPIRGGEALEEMNIFTQVFLCLIPYNLESNLHDFYSEQGAVESKVRIRTAN